MSKRRRYTEYEIKELLKNRNVVAIKDKSQIVYSNQFKLWAIKNKLAHPYKTATQIFEEANFSMKILDRKTPQNRLSNWFNNFKRYGAEYFDDNAKTYSTKEQTISSNNINILISSVNKLIDKIESKCCGKSNN